MNLSAVIIEKVLSGYSLTSQLTSVNEFERPTVQALTFHSMRYLGWATSISKKLVKNFPNKLFECLLLLTLTLLKKKIGTENNNANLFADIPIYNQYTVVDQAVHAACNCLKLKQYKNLLNAVLRRYLRKENTWVEKNLEAKWNHKDWWIKLLKNSYPGQWKRILNSANFFSPLTLRINSRRACQEEIFQLFSEKGFISELIGESAIAILTPKPINSLPGFDQGLWSVQDFGAQIAVPLLEVKNGMHVLDACAAPGGKTAHFLELADVDLLAVDIKRNRLNFVRENLVRLGLNSKKVCLKASDVSILEDWWNGSYFDAVLADVPCTASGIVRRHPDIRWIRNRNDIRHIVKRQKSILESLWKTVIPGGKLLYSTCSIFPDEGEKQASDFCKNHKDAIRLDAPGQILPIESSESPCKFVKHDGFFYALFSKSLF